MSTTDSSVNWADVSVLVNLTSLLGTKLSDNLGSEPVRFDLNARLDEKERRNGRVVVLFGLSVRTKPNVAKYEIEGTATLIGKEAQIEQILKVDPKSNIPFVFHRVYQHVFTAVYMLASILGTIYPPPDLFSGEQNIPIKNFNGGEHTENSKVPEAAPAVNAAEQAKQPDTVAFSVKKEETAVNQPAAAT